VHELSVEAWPPKDAPHSLPKLGQTHGARAVPVKGFEVREEKKRKQQMRGEYIIVIANKGIKKKRN
jgi:hypothetical protein